MPALTGMRILDMTQYEAGTSCTQALAWMGADVVKIESPEGGDPGRSLMMGGLWQDSEYFVNWNSNKRSVAIDLRKPEGRELLLKMAPKYDVFIENYGPGVIEKLNLGYDVMKKLNPGIIYARIKGFGAGGPYAGYKSFDIVGQAAAGALSITGEPDGPPMRCGPTIGDVGTGVQTALAITAAYVQKLRTGEGQLIEISMQEAVTYFMRTMIAMGSKWGTQAAERRGNGVNPILNIFPCRGGGPNDYIYIMALTPRMWEVMCEAMGRPELAIDERFKDAEGRRANEAALREELCAWTGQHGKFDAMKILGDAGVPCSAIFDTRDLFTHPQLVERGFIHTVEHPELGPVQVLGWPARMSASEVAIEAAPLLGNDTSEVLAEDLGISPHDVARMVEAGIVGAGKSPVARS